MPESKIDLDYSGPDGLSRTQLFLRAKLATWLEAPALFATEAVGPDGAGRLRAIARAILSEIDSHEEGAPWVDPRERCDELAAVAASQIETAIDIVRSKVEDPDSPQQAEQAARFEDRVQRFGDWFGNGRDCSCDVCRDGRDYATLMPASFRPDETGRIPSCLCRFAREAEIARFFVEQLYGDLLPAGSVRADVVFALPAAGQVTVNGVTSYRAPVSMRRPVNRAAPKRTVEVVVSLPAEVDVTRLYSLLYVAVHELGIHSVQQMGLSRAPKQKETDPIFSEGMVEAAIYDALAEVITDENARYLLLDAYSEACRKRHELHCNPPGKGMTDPGDISVGAQTYDKLVRFGYAAERAGFIRTEAFLKGVRPVRQLSRVLNGRRWARRAVLALNLLPLDGAQQGRLHCWLDTRLGQFTPPEKSLGELEEQKRQLGALPADDPLVSFLHLLNQISRNPHNPRFFRKLLREIGG